MSRSYQGEAEGAPLGAPAAGGKPATGARQRGPGGPAKVWRGYVAPLWVLSSQGALEAAWRGLRGHRGPMVAVGVAAGVLARLLAP